MNFDFSSLNFETIDSNINAYPDMYLNQSGVTFSKKVLEDLGYPAYVLGAGGYGLSRLCAVPAGWQGKGVRNPYVQEQ